MNKEKLITLVDTLRHEEFIRQITPVQKELDREYNARAGPLVRPRGIPTKEKLQYRYRNYVGSLFHIVDRPEFQSWLLTAVGDSLISERQLLEYALSMPAGLRYMLEAISPHGVMETLRRMRDSWGSNRLLVILPLILAVCETNGDIPISYSDPTRNEYGIFGLYAFYGQYLRRSVLSAKARVRVRWVGLMPPTSTIYLGVDSPPWTGGLEIVSSPPLPEGIRRLLVLRYVRPKCPCRCPPEIAWCNFRRLPCWKQDRFWDRLEQRQKDKRSKDKTSR